MAISLVSRSCTWTRRLEEDTAGGQTCSLLLNTSTILASLERPSTCRERGVEESGTVAHLAPGEVAYGDVAHEGDEVVLAQAAGRLRGLEEQLGEYLNISMSFTTTISSVGSLKTAFWGLTGHEAYKRQVTLTTIWTVSW